MVLLSRLMLKGEYGSFRQLIYIQATIVSVMGLCLSKVSSNYLPLYSKEQGKDIVFKFFIILLGFAALIGGSVLLMNPLICEFFKNTDLAPLINIFALIIFFNIPVLGIEGIYTTYKRTQVFGLFTILNKIGFLLFLAVPFVFKSVNLLILTKFWLLHSAIIFLTGLVLFFYPFRNLKQNKSNVGYGQIIKFIIPLIFSSLLGLAFTASDQFYISHFFGKEVYAEYSNGMTQIPFIGILITSIGSVIYPFLVDEFGKKKIDTQKIAQTIKEISLKSIYIIYPIIIFIWLASEEIYILLFGHEYVISASYFKIATIYNLFSVFIFFPIILALKEMRFYNIVHFVAVGLIWGLHFLSVYLFMNPLLIPIITLVIKIGIVASQLLRIVNRLNLSVNQLIPIKKALVLIFTCILGSCPYYFLIYHYHEETAKMQWFFLFIGFMLYLTVLYLTNRDIMFQFKEILSKLKKKR